MMSRRHLDHRRANVRFEVLGVMPAALQTSETFRVLNLGTSGALVEASLPLAWNAEYEMQLVLETAIVSPVRVKVRRVVPVETPAGVRYQMGIEFLSLSREAEDAIGEIVLARQAAV